MLCRSCFSLFFQVEAGETGAKQKRQSKALPHSRHDAFRRRFEQELALGQKFQKEYQDYESRRIGEGASVRDAHFFDAFEKDREPIATVPGEEERTCARRVVTRRYSLADPEHLLPWGILVGGASAFAVALLWFLGSRLRSRS